MSKIIDEDEEQMSSSRLDEISKEKVLFLKQLSQDPYVDINALIDTMNLDQARAWGYVNEITTMLRETTPRDYYKIINILNKGIKESSFHIEEDELDRLSKLVPKSNEVQKIASNKIQDKENNIMSHYPKQPQTIAHSTSSLGTIPSDNAEPAKLNASSLNNPTVEEENPIKSYSDFNVATLNKGYNYSFLQELNRLGLMRWCLTNLPTAPSPPRIEAWIRNFELNQDIFMSSPEVFSAKMVDWWGEKIGKEAAKSFISFIKYLKPAEGFGVRKLDGMTAEGFGLGGAGIGSAGYENSAIFNQFSNPFQTYYHQKGVLPFGADIRSPDSQRLIAEYDQKERKRKEKEEYFQEIMEAAKLKTQYEFSNMLSNKGVMGGGNGNGNGGSNGMSAIMQVLPFMMNGNMRILPKPVTDANGNSSIEWMPNPYYEANGNGNGNTLSAKDILDYQTRMFDTIERKSSENSKLRDEILTNLLNSFQNKGSVANEMIELHKVMKEIGVVNGGNNGSNILGGNFRGDPIEIAKVMIEAKKLDNDVARADKLIENKYKYQQEDKKLAFEESKESNKLRNTMVKGITQLISSNIPVITSLFLILTGRGKDAEVLRGLGGGSGAAQPASPLGGLGNILGGLLGGGGGGLGGLLGGLTGGGNSNDDEDEDTNPFSQPPQPEPQQDFGAGNDNNPLSGLLGGLLGGNNTNAVHSPNPNVAPQPPMDINGMINNILGTPNPSPTPTNNQKKSSTIAPRGSIYQPVTQGNNIYDDLENASKTNRNIAGNKFPNNEVEITPPKIFPANAYDQMQEEVNPVASIPTMKVEPIQITTPPINDNIGNNYNPNEIDEDAEMASGQKVWTQQEVWTAPPNTNTTIIQEEIVQPVPTQEIDEDAEVQTQTQEEYPIYSPEQFQGASKEELLQRYQEGQKAMQSNVSYLESIKQAFNIK